MKKEELALKLQKYIDKCFADALVSENRPKNTKCEMRWFLIKNHKDKWQFCAISTKCKYTRVTRRVLYRLSKNIEKNFGVEWDNTGIFSMLTYEDGQVDPNFAQYMFDVDGKHIVVSVFDHTDEDFDRTGRFIPAYRYERLLVANAGLDINSITSAEFNPLVAEGADWCNRWDDFKKVYEKAFGEGKLGRYDIICGPGVKRV